MKELKFWVDKDSPPYIKGENPELDAILEELTEKMVKEVESGKFDEPKLSDSDARYDKR